MISLRDEEDLISLWYRENETEVICLQDMKDHENIISW